MKHIHDIDSKDSLKTLITQDLRERGIRIPKQKGKEIVNKENECGVFGNPLHCLPALYVEDCGYVPRFLIEAVDIIEKHLECEGLFRKTGSVSRQKELKIKINDGESIDDANVFDLTSLVKQFFRDLPDPLLTCRLHGPFIQAYQIDEEETRLNTILSLCLLLPWEHLSTLRFTMLFLAKVASYSTENKMDVTNLAVVLTPNLMNINNRSEKMSLAEGRLLQVQTLIVEMLIMFADKIGLVSDILNEKSALMASCFASDDELEKGGNEDKPKKKKRRSGSLQGIISGINQSISKWRANSGHNTSKNGVNESLSIVDSSTLSDSTEGGFVIQERVPSIIDATPKLMRKRKADEDMVPFSATKKKAILQQMPAMSALGSTPFTPASAMRHRKDQKDFTLGTPNIHFSEDNYVVFSAHGREQRNLNTPSVKPQLLPAGSAQKAKRQTANKTDCSSKSAAMVTTGSKKSVKGIFRRLSGNKGQPPAPAKRRRESPDVALRLSFTDDDTALHADSETPSKKKRGLFRPKHKKTPSSPARLLGPDFNLSLLSQQSQLENQSCVVDTCSTSYRSEVGQSSVLDHTCDTASISDKALARQLERDLMDIFGGQKTATKGPEKCEYLSDSTQMPSTTLKRGKPNTLRAGLPMTKQRRSFDSTDSCAISVEDFRKSDKETEVYMDLETGEATESENCHFHSDSLVQESQGGRTEALDTSTCKERTYVPTKDASQKANVPSHSDSKHSVFQCTSGSSLSISPDQSMRSEVVPAEEVTHALEPLDVGAYSHSGNTSHVSVMQHEEISSSNKQPETETVSRGTEQNGSSVHTEDQNVLLKGTKNTLSENGTFVARSESFHAERKPTLIDIDEAVQLSRRPSVRELCPSQGVLHKKKAMHRGPAESTLHVSRSETHNIQSCAGAVGKKSQYSNVAVISASTAEEVTREHGECKNKTFHHDSIADLKSANAGGVAKNVSRFNEMTFTVEELSERHTSPYRFHRSMLRTKGTSPVRIPSIFAKADKDAAKFREMAMNSSLVRHTNKSLAHPISDSKGKPCLPVSDTMVRNPCVEQPFNHYHSKVADFNAARNKLCESTSKSNSESSYSDSQFTSVTKEWESEHTNPSPKESTIREVCTRKNENVFRNANVEALKNFAKRLSGSPEVSAEHEETEFLQLKTPKIKPSILSHDITKALLQKTQGQPVVARIPTSETPVKCRSPVKPVKRLHGSPGSPRSPRKYPTSPRKPLKLCRKQGFSPIPAHIKEFTL